ncbi:RNA polymerase, sigma 28 subunit, SigD/FliA/WhiG [Pelagirhabdus alkalitolerans]|uniref:RNA polymerase, sigma 28 subunit, SigD/FliA/WhiG n=1 Tax=Pelagirhabdus alkalitolerans TaxID=1612202 RepID=A0A1G6H3M2_9BACI|nr:FliA/WhiG family RNA polymerase sigma factor [Pelagirhabdus alkalitolerans]SDB88910.1 RNA polymerase, sigma 28 subunit, SigD/FliA/WhiG [Pelagirhabdus alkalitolerans]
MENDTTTINHLWEKWIEQRDTSIANQLVEHYLYLVEYHSQRIGAHLPKNVSREDVFSLGLYGLYDALQRFQPERDLKFDTYASFRVRGAIMDGLRKEDWLPRSTRDRAKRIEEAQQVLTQQLEREPTSQEIASHIGLSVDDVTSSFKDIWFGHLLSMEEKTNDESSEFKEGIGYTVKDQNEPSPEDALLKQETVSELAESIQELNQNEQMVISLFYQDELTFTEIGHVLSLTTSRISQIHKQALFKLKHTLSNH